jgi:hypothetical protein
MLQKHSRNAIVSRISHGVSFPWGQHITASILNILEYPCNVAYLVISAVGNRSGFLPRRLFRGGIDSSQPCDDVHFDVNRQQMFPRITLLP